MLAWWHREEGEEHMVSTACACKLENCRISPYTITSVSRLISLVWKTPIALNKMMWVVTK